MLLWGRRAGQFLDCVRVRVRELRFFRVRICHAADRIGGEFGERFEDFLVPRFHVLAGMEFTD